MPDQDTARVRTARSGTYLTIRATGVLLAVLALGHFGVTHIVNDVAATDSSFVARRWSSALWVVWDALLLAMALLHVGAAMGAVVRDHCPGRGARRAVLAGMRVLIAALFVLGALTLVVAAG
ncbi:succinate dehydrogenase / fumarate reductase membrane anchor subunit [Murinocardiopsis flavida]|uniref:Succinate dehydrogenase / fumarate reductase membrane anchor subunit n=1 Tax=Murinocardiopsis flavida TaxID=645275 RepID=A0A2P8DTT2_9ACTN|nr:succinate dehydrogenase hydrophobic membrane anchor protein [Murinocardiopsis flavida]PSL00627.1 succinate dehydrogenase / fumarate reductase membrane anchor subunit [Murinocardiopsis flavida]